MFTYQGINICVIQKQSDTSLFQPPYLILHFFIYTVQLFIIDSYPVPHTSNLIIESPNLLFYLMIVFVLLRCWDTFHFHCIFCQILQLICRIANDSHQNITLRPSMFIVLHVTCFTPQQYLPLPQFHQNTNQLFC